MRMPGIAFLSFALFLGSSWAGLETSLGSTRDLSFFSPVNPPPSNYRIDARIDVRQGTLEGEETVSLRNASRNPIGVLAFDWDVGPASSMEVVSSGKKLYPPADFSLAVRKGPQFIHLAQPLYPEMQIELLVKFRLNGLVAMDNTGISTSRWYPRLWWNGLGRHDSFSVKLDVPEGYVLAASGRRDPNTGRFEAASAANFGI
jgi:hypothetical protein